MNDMSSAPVLTPGLADAMTGWRRELHQHPELAHEERWTADFVHARLREFGLDPVAVGGTGVVAVIDSGQPGPSVALRADIDALPMDDRSGRDYASRHAGVAHACGHDGHTAALLGTARHLAAHPPRTGRVVLIFQPAEENGKGARAMIDDGLLERFAFDEVYGFHNMPLLDPGQAGVRAGPVLNGYIVWRIAVTGVGGHGAAFYKAVDPLQAAARLAVEISSIVGRYVDPAEAALINVASLQAGTNHNIIADSASLSGTLRALKPEVQALLFERLERACAGIAAMTGCEVACEKLAEVPPCVNAPEAAAHATHACAAVVGDGGIVADHPAYPFTDDMALLLNAAPGAYLFLGQDSVMCHNPEYDFDDALLPVAAGIFVQLVTDRLGLTAS
ncbi:amidohydrolase [Pelagerythrobacter sp.]|uniref:amidohydrolase n=1 Tax=Pelagerythrobacter sp. TaxID=2800702 RepID=UPI0035B11C1B